ncbi:ImmA/IrrE family metallo-endopeptidase [Actinokineospora xionganensis]|uniref:ImmA/IrrE family metallo-endopeptidase n=1 Tax=Actinokineospora xionganensis TaxID=2684470 RepID=A0ABR7L5V7_9PSEU|nr:ImmA/IrrE family metallo-endopeptidase [Actinokineospora xionganensis]MBC6447972.1 ImmA/IrrE family metallo-endopeptidase [Actinokineospora xionganensis]
MHAPRCGAQAAPGHYLIEHQFDTILLTEEGCRRFDGEKEKQTKFLSGELLIPWKAAVRAAFDEKTNEQVACEFGVSEQFAQMRMAGARVFARNALARQRRGYSPTWQRCTRGL